MTCTKAALVEALRDGRLGPQESASVERHLATCAECAALARDLDRIGAALRAPSPPATPLEHQRARVALLERAALAPASERPRPALLRPLLVSLVAAMAVAAGWSTGRVAPPQEKPPIALHAPIPPAASPSAPPASRDFAAAMAAIRRGDYGGAAAQLEAFTAAHPADARADEADYLEAVALQRAGRLPEAAAAARRYLATRPHGAHRPEAAQIVEPPQ